MKSTSLFFLLALLFLSNLQSRATVVTITVQNFQFTPANVTLNCGDTILWERISGDHTVTSVTIPNGAAAFDGQVNTDFSTFTYTPTVPGTYSYKCTPHASMGMTATFTVSCPQGISSGALSEAIRIAPNPFHDQLSIQGREGDLIEMMNLHGQVLKQENGSGDFFTGDLGSGVYLIRISRNGNIIDHRKVIRID